MSHRLGTPFSWKFHGTPQRADEAVDRTTTWYKEPWLSKSGCLKVAVYTTGSSEIRTDAGSSHGRSGFLHRPAELVRAVWATGHSLFPCWIFAQDPRRGASKLEIELPA